MHACEASICAPCAGQLLDRPSITTPTQIATPIPTASQSGSEVAEYRATPTPTPSAVAAPYVVPWLRFFPSTGLSLLLSLSMCSATFHSWERTTYHNRQHAHRQRTTGVMGAHMCRYVRVISVSSFVAFSIWIGRKPFVGTRTRRARRASIRCCTSRVAGC
jgi:hypothetical protein